MKDSYWFKHDCNAHEDLKLVKIKRIYSHWGIGIFWEVIEILRTQNEYKYPIKESDLQFLCEDLLRCNDFTKFQTWLNDCFNIKPDPLFLHDDLYFWSESLLDRMNLWEVKKTNGSKGGRGKKSETKAKLKLIKSETKAKLKRNASNVLRKDKIIENNNSDFSFSLFWNSYHQISGKPKTDKVPAEKYWDKLTDMDRQKAIENIESYCDSVDNKKYIKKARTYLSDKNFNDEQFDFNKGSTEETGNTSGFIPNPEWTEQ